MPYSFHSVRLLSDLPNEPFYYDANLFWFNKRETKYEKKCMAFKYRLTYTWQNYFARYRKPFLDNKAAWNTYFFPGVDVDV